VSLFQSITTQTATIASGQSLSGQVGLGEKQLCGIAMPASWTTADITFQASPDGGASWLELDVSDGKAADAAVTMQIHSPTAAHFIAIDPSPLLGVNNIKVRSGTSGSPVAQTGGAVLTLIARGAM
jgi:hypothetical protein